MISVTREQHDCPREIQELLTRAGGLNRFSEPNFRIVWGGSRLNWVAGEWVDYSDDDGRILVRRVVEYRQVPKYFAELNRWHVEKWVSPEEYGSPLLWKIQTTEFYGNRSVEALGAFPSRGEYELSHTLGRPCAKCIRSGMPDDCTHREFVQLTPTIAETIAHMIIRSQATTAQERKAALERARARADKAREAAIEEVLGADPTPVSKERADYLERVIVPQLDIALARAAKNRRGQPARPSRYHASVSRISN